MGENLIKVNSIKIALCQVNPTVGDICGNTKLILEHISRAKEKGASLVVFPEMVISGYPPEDLLFKPDFIKTIESALKFIKNKINDITVILGAPLKDNSNLYNSAVLISNQKLIDLYHKQLLPNYGVFDEKRYFKEGRLTKIWNVMGLKILPTICEDIWDLSRGPISKVSNSDIDLIINISASPYHVGKIKKRFSILKSAAKRLKTDLIYVNLVGGQDELVFDGGSMFVSRNGEVLKQLPQFKEGLFLISTTNKTNKKIKPEQITLLPKEQEIFSALVLGLRDYVNKNNFKGVVIGLSGGIDSSLALCLAVEALGKSRVFSLSMPSRFNSKETQEDVKKLTANLGIRCHWISIEPIFNAFLSSLDSLFKGLEFDVTEENIQARIRAVLLMAVSNKFGYLVLTTGNKSEMSVGYCTLYGDMAGGFAILKDVPKTMVYKLAKYYNKLKKKQIIPTSVITRPPSAELRYNQKDEDSLIPYPLLDKIIDAYVEKHMEYDQILALGIPKDAVDKIIRLIDKSEYKRRQAPLGVKITPLAFGKDWRMPITNRFIVGRGFKLT